MANADLARGSAQPARSFAQAEDGYAGMKASGKTTSSAPSPVASAVSSASRSIVALAIEDDRLGLDAGDGDGALHSGRVAPCGDYPGGVTTIFVDFDGTITEQDLLDRIAQTFGIPAVYREVDEALDEGRITLNEVLRREFEPVRAPLDDVVAWVLEHASVRPGFRELVERASERGWRVVIVSSGFRELIEPVLAARGHRASVELLSNRVVPDPAGWRVRFGSTDDCPSAGSRASAGRWSPRPTATCAVYIGDGVSDRCGAQACDLVFARRGLAAYLDEEGVPFEEFDDFFRVADGIDEALARR